MWNLAVRVLDERRIDDGLIFFEAVKIEHYTRDSGHSLVPTDYGVEIRHQAPPAEGDDLGTPGFVTRLIPWARIEWFESVGEVSRF